MLKFILALVLYKSMRQIKYSKEALEKAVESSKCISDVMFLISGKRRGGAVFDHIKRKIKEYEIDTSHFLGKAAYAGPNQNGKCKKKLPEEILVDGYESRAPSHLLRRALIESGIKYICFECGIDPIWNSKELVLQIHHMDGNWSNCKKENMVFLCPNCHTQTESYCNYESGNRCANCKKKISFKSKWCLKCSGLFRKRDKKVENRPNLETLLNETEEFGYVKTGKKYGVSDNAVRNWIKNYQMSNQKQKCIQFYREEIPNHVDCYLSNMMSWSNYTLEMDHDYVQWMFPSNEPSGINEYAPVMTKEESEIFEQDSELREKAKKSFVRFLNFLDFELVKDDETGIEIKSIEEPPKWIAIGFNHNMLRVTRVMKSMRLTGNTQYAIALFDVLRSYRNKISDNTWSFWHSAIFDPLW